MYRIIPENDFTPFFTESQQAENDPQLLSIETLDIYYFASKMGHTARRGCAYFGVITEIISFIIVYIVRMYTAHLRRYVQVSVVFLNLVMFSWERLVKSGTWVQPLQPLATVLVILPYPKM